MMIGGPMAAWSSQLNNLPVIAILRATNAEHFVEASMVLAKAGFCHFEYTMTTRGALDALKTAKKVLSSSAFVGVGSVRTKDDVKAAHAAGAQFMFSQYGVFDVVEESLALGVPIIPGALTPTEVAQAWSWGVDAVKISPVNPLGGVSYLRELSAPLPEIPLIPTGGVQLEDVSSYLHYGAYAVGLSRHLFLDVLEDGHDMAGLHERAIQVVSAVSEMRKLKELQ